MIEKVYGINATSITLNDRFTLLAELVPMRVMRPRKFLVSHALSNKSYNFRSQNITQGRAYHLQQNNRVICFEFTIIDSQAQEHNSRFTLEKFELR